MGSESPLAEPKGKAPVLAETVAKSDCPRTLAHDSQAKVTSRYRALVEPASVIAHHTRILWGYGQMEQSLRSSHLIEENLKELATLRTATLVGCPF